MIAQKDKEQPLQRWLENVTVSRGKPQGYPETTNHLEKNGAPDRIRTHDPQIRSLVLYPAELRALTGAVPSLVAAEMQGCSHDQGRQRWNNRALGPPTKKPRDFSRGSFVSACG